MIHDVIRDKLIESKLITAQGRRNEIRKYLDYYSGTSTDQYINKFFDGDAFSEIPPHL